MIYPEPAILIDPPRDPRAGADNADGSSSSLAHSEAFSGHAAPRGADTFPGGGNNFSVHPIPERVGNCADVSEPSGVANRIGQDGGELTAVDGGDAVSRACCRPESTSAAVLICSPPSPRPSPPGEGESTPIQGLSEKAQEQENGWRKIRDDYLDLRAAGYSKTEAAKALNIGRTTLYRILKETGGRKSKLGNCGKRSVWQKFSERQDVYVRLQQLYLLTCGASSDYMSKDRRTGSAALALERFADEGMCPALLALQLRSGRYPNCLVSIIRRITAEVEQRHRGSKHASLNGTLIMRRTTEEILADGTKQQIELGDWWVFDDMSDNQPFYFLGPDGKPLVGRQGLYSFDVRRHWLGVELIGTSRDSYTAAIILRFMRRLMQAIGKPKRGVVLEQSVWKARVISGFRLTREGGVIEDEFEREGMSDGQKALLQDGLKALGIQVHYTYTPRGKEIEGAFNYLQRVAPTMAMNSINIGRHAGEFEQGAKALRRAHAGSHHPAKLGFAEMDERADLLERAMAWINRRTSWQANGVEGELRAYPPLAALSMNDLAAFLPSKHEIEIRGGKVSPEVDGVAHDFCHPELFASLGGKYRLYVKFDPSEPTLGAAIYNRETSSANWQRWPVGQLVGWADYLPPVARFDWRPKDGREDAAGEMKKRFNKYVRTAFRAVGMPQFKAATARDGAGNVAVKSETSNAQHRTSNIELPRPNPPRAAIAAPVNAEQMDTRLADRARRLRELQQTDD